MAFKLITITFLLIITSNCLYGRKKIIWDTTSMMKIDDNIDYCRIRFLSDGNMAVFYRHLLGCNLKIFDHDMKCLMTKRVFSNKNFYNKDIQDSAYVLMSTPDMIELDTGRLLYVCNYRPLKGHRYPFCIASSYSDDKGRSWSEPVVIYEADTLYENGCWEPVLLQHKNGNVQLYFSNENRFRRTDEQEIDMIESCNGGKSWSKRIRRVSYRKGHRDGMPVPRIYGDTIYIAIEDNIHGQFHPCILTIPITGNQHQYVDGNSLLRKQVSEGVIPIENYSGAPYLAIDSLGVQYISCQTTYGREDNNQSTATMLLLIREDNKITEMTYPFDIPQDKYGKWGAIELKNDHEIWVTISSNVEGQCAPYIMKGEIMETEN